MKGYQRLEILYQPIKKCCYAGLAVEVQTGLSVLDDSIINTVMLGTTFPRTPFPLCFQVKGEQK